MECRVTHGHLHAPTEHLKHPGLYFPKLHYCLESYFYSSPGLLPLGLVHLPLAGDGHNLQGNWPLLPQHPDSKSATGCLLATGPWKIYLSSLLDCCPSFSSEYNKMGTLSHFSQALQNGLSLPLKYRHASGPLTQPHCPQPSGRLRLVFITT